ncbi:MAG: BamA/TamA family outer membrane protein [Pseudomonadales bacterium]|nr:BamA/TamA family outer membrane protein [Pseudomonadales bacterium]
MPTVFRLLAVLAGLWYGPSASASAANGPCQRAFQPTTAEQLMDHQQSPDEPVSPGSRIGEIHLTRHQIFNEENPDEDNPVFRWANRFHILTTEKTIREELLFRAGDIYDQQQVDESARLLRSAKYLYEAKIRPVNPCGDTVDIEVVTRDVWSFTPEIAADRSGGESNYRVALRDTNFLGSGRFISVAGKKDTDRETVKFVYEDKNLGSSRIGARLAYTDADDGESQYIRLQRPFYSLDTRYAWQVSLETDSRYDTQYFRGEKQTQVQHEVENFSVSYGFSDGLVDGRATRWTLGYTWHEDQFYPGRDYPSPAEFPDDRRLSYPFVNLTMVEDKYATAFNLDQIHRTEDLHTGYTFSTTLGYADAAFGSDEDRLVLTSRFADTLSYTDKVLLQHELAVSGYWNLDRQAKEDLLIDYEIRYFRTQTDKRSFFARLHGIYSDGLNENQQVTLGGDVGARAFSSRFQQGDRMMVLSLEERQYTDVHFLNLIRLGFAGFVDIGRAWQPGRDDGIEQDILANAGIGIRLASSKADTGGIIHIDFAFPLTNRDDPEVEDVQISVNIKDSF